jgi:hypothetical protein
LAAYIAKVFKGEADLIFCKNLRSAPEAEEKGEVRKIRREQTKRRTRTEGEKVEEREE